MKQLLAKASDKIIISIKRTKHGHNVCIGVEPIREINVLSCSALENFSPNHPISHRNKLLNPLYLNRFIRSEKIGRRSKLNWVVYG